MWDGFYVRYPPHFTGLGTGTMGTLACDPLKLGFCNGVNVGFRVSDLTRLHGVKATSFQFDRRGVKLKLLLCIAAIPANERSSTNGAVDRFRTVPELTVPSAPLEGHDLGLCKAPRDNLYCNRRYINKTELN